MKSPAEERVVPVLHRTVTPGRVTLVGAGPGDPDLLTVRAAKVLMAAQCVLYDHLVSETVLALVPAGAERIYVGKESGCHAMPQAQIAETLVRLARGGRHVVRLKGGDPYVFGRGGEEVEALVDAGVPFEVVPGITAAQGMSVMAGMPLTHRDHASSVVFATGHGKEGAAESDWIALARPRQTVVFYMGMAALPRICERLVAHGLPADTPAAVVERATTPQQRVIVATVASLPAVAAAQGASAPALIVVCSVVLLHERLGQAAPADVDTCVASLQAA